MKIDSNDTTSCEKLAKTFKKKKKKKQLCHFSIVLHGYFQASTFSDLHIITLSGTEWLPHNRWAYRTPEFSCSLSTTVSKSAQLYPPSRVHLPHTQHTPRRSLDPCSSNSFSSSAPQLKTSPLEFQVYHTNTLSGANSCLFFMMISISKLLFANVFYTCSYSSACIYGDKPPHATALKNWDYSS